MVAVDKKGNNTNRRGSCQENMSVIMIYIVFKLLNMSSRIATLSSRVLFPMLP